VKLVNGSVSNWIQTSATGVFDRYQKIRGQGRGHIGFPGADVFQVDFGVSFGNCFERPGFFASSADQLRAGLVVFAADELDVFFIYRNRQLPVADCGVGRQREGEVFSWFGGDCWVSSKGRGEEGQEQRGEEDGRFHGQIFFKAQVSNKQDFDQRE